MSGELHAYGISVEHTESRPSRGIIGARGFGPLHSERHIANSGTCSGRSSWRQPQVPVDHSGALFEITAEKMQFADTDGTVAAGSQPLVLPVLFGAVRDTRELLTIKWCTRERLEPRRFGEGSCGEPRFRCTRRTLAGRSRSALLPFATAPDRRARAGPSQDGSRESSSRTRTAGSKPPSPPAPAAQTHSGS